MIWHSTVPEQLMVNGIYMYPCIAQCYSIIAQCSVPTQCEQSIVSFATIIFQVSPTSLGCIVVRLYPLVLLCRRFVYECSILFYVHTAQKSCKYRFILYVVLFHIFFQLSKLVEYKQYNSLSLTHALLKSTLKIFMYRMG